MDNAPQPPAPPPEKKTLPLVVIIAIVALGIPLVLSIVLAVIALAGGVVAYFLASRSVDERPPQVYVDPVLEEYEPPEPVPLEIEDLPETPGDEAGQEEPGGTLEAAVIKSVMGKNSSGFKHCYETALVEDPALEGKVTIAFTIGTTGEVTQAEVGASTLGNAEVEACLVDRVKKLVFPEPAGGIVKVSYPLVFTPAG